MAGDWIKMRADLHDDPAVFRLSSMLKIDRFSVVGRLHAFWSWADKHSVDGRVDGATPHLVDTIATLDGFADALMVVGWLSHDDRGIVIPNFERHNGKTAKERALKNQRQSRWRKVGAGVDGHVDGGVDVPTSTREEKRRDITPISPRGFEEFWKSYPAARRIGKGKCLAKWQKFGLEAKAPEVVALVEALKRTPQWLKDGGQFVPTSLTWLNQERFRDDMPQAEARRLAI